MKGTTVTYECYDGCTCRRFTETQLKKEERIRKHMGYSWFENYTISIDDMKKYKLGKNPSIGKVRKVVRGV